MRTQIRVILALVACIGLASCGGKGAPKGQVVAKVGKDEVTVLDLQSEMAGFNAPNAQIRKLAEQRALSTIIQRKLLVREAKKEKIDKSPEYARQLERASEALLVKTWQNNLVRAVPPPSPDEVRQFIEQHPDLYSARKRFNIIGVRYSPPNDPTLAKAMSPLNTLEDVAALLTERKIAFSNGGGEIDALAIDPRVVDQLLKLKPNEVFVLPQGNVAFVGKINSVSVDPVSAEIANRHATQYLKMVRTQEMLNRRFGSVVQTGLKDVTYNKDYAPPKPAPAAKAPPAATTPPASASPAAASPAVAGPKNPGTPG